MWWIGPARTATLLLVLTLIAIFIYAAPVSYRYILDRCITVESFGCPDSPPGLEALAAQGITPAFYAGYYTALNIALALIYLAVAAVIYWRRSHEPMSLLAVVMLVIFGLISWPDTVANLAHTDPTWGRLIMILPLVGWVAFTLFFTLFPNGRFEPPWTRWVGLTSIIYAFGYLPSPDSPFQHRNWHPLAVGLCMAGWAFSLLYVQVYRYRKISGPAERSQTKWVVLGLAGTLLLFLGLVGLITLFDAHPEPGANPVRGFITMALLYLGMILVPISLGFAILKHRLWDIDPIINRTLVYGALSAIVIGLYVLVVGYFGSLLGSDGNLVISLMATGLVAVLFQPLRDRLQRAVNRLLYGDRDDPYAVLAGLGRQLGAALTQENVLPTVVRTVRDALRLPYAAVALYREGEPVVAASIGEPTEELLRIPLVHAGEEVGQLQLAPRSPGEPFEPADRRLLDDLVRQAGAAVQSVRLTMDLRRLTVDLQRSRERLVLAREEERRRLRRDLHDDLAPKLAALALTTAAAEDLLMSDEAAAAKLLTELRSSIRETVGDIRRLVYDLRPPTLDDLGLIAAVRERAAQYSGPLRGMGGDEDAHLDVVVEAPAHLPPLPAAVEVAAYRIIHEALMNVVKHAHARRCQIKFSIANAGLEVEVHDDGVGPAESRRAGVGLGSMRERATELGGTCTIGRGPQGGTLIRAWMPLATPGMTQPPLA